MFIFANVKFSLAIGSKVFDYFKTSKLVMVTNILSEYNWINENKYKVLL